MGQIPVAIVPALYIAAIGAVMFASAIWR